MHRISLVFVTLLWAIITLSKASFAADQYAYRAGQTYMKFAANNHIDCEAQCRGDAPCQSWNFIRPNPRSRTGICEFNARQAAPMSSPISISGAINIHSHQAMNRVVTERPIYAPQMASAPLNTQRTAPKNNFRNARGNVSGNVSGNLRQRVVQNIPEEHIIRAPIPAGYRPIAPARKTNALSPTANIRTVRQPLTQARLQPHTGYLQPRSMTRQQIYNEQIYATQIRAEAQAKLLANAQIQQAQYRAVSPPRPLQQYAPNTRQAPQIRYVPQISRAPQISRTSQTPGIPQISKTQAPKVQMPPRIPTAAPNQQSLYGSLYDDLTQNMSPVPRPQAVPDQMSNPGAPIATNRPVQTITVQETPFNYPTIAGLAGG